MNVLKRDINKLDKLIAKDKLVVEQNAHSSRAIIKLINGYFWRSISEPVMAFVFPLILVCILGFSIGYTLAFPGAFCLGVFTVGLNSMPTTILDFKKSTLLKRIGVTPIKPWKLLLIICLYYIVLMIVSTTFVICVSILFFIKYWKNGETIDMVIIGLDKPYRYHMMSLKETLTHIDWVAFLYAFLLMIITTSSIGLMFSSICNSSGSILTCTLVVVLFSLLLGGQTVPVYIIKSSKPLWYCGYALTPYKAALTMITEAWNGPFNDSDPIIKMLGIDSLMNCEGSRVFDVTKEFKMFSTVVLPGVEAGKPITIVGEPEKILDIFLSFAWILMPFAVTLKKFKWSSR